MAQVVDSKGKTKASSSGKVMTSGKKGASSLREDLARNTSINTTKTPDKNTLASTLERAMRFVSKPRVSSSGGKQKSYSGISGGTPVVGSQPSSLGWSPTNSSASKPGMVPKQNNELAPMTTTQDGIMTASGLHPDVKPISITDVRNAVNDNILEPMGHDLDHQAGLDVWEQESAKKQGRDVRTSNYWGEDYDTDGAGFGWIDNQLDYVGNTATNDAYIRDMIDSGRITEDQAYALMHMPHQWEWMQDFNDNGEIDTYGDVYNDNTASFWGKPKDAVIDDGVSSTYAEITSPTMTGTQYRHYRDDLGMGGSDDIDLTRTYSKMDEARENGFIPFIPNTETYAEMVGKDMLDTPFQIWRNIANARMQYLTPDFQIDYDDNGELKSIPGKEFERLAPVYMNEFYHDRQYNPDRYLSAPDEGEYSTLVNQIEIPDSEGNVTYHYGHLVDVHDMPDGTFQFAFSDGSRVKTSKEFLDSVYDEETGIIDLGSSERVPLEDVANIVDIENFGDNKHRGMINEVMIPDEFGNETYHYYMDTNNDDDVPPFSVDIGPNGTYTFTFQDGTSVNAPQSYFDQVYDPEQGTITLPFDRVWVDDIKGDADITYDEPEKRDLYNSDLVYYPDLVLSDGTRMTLDDVERLWLDQTPDDDKDMIDPETGDVIASDDDIRYHFGTMGDKVRDVESNVPVIGGLLSSVPTPGKWIADHITNRPSRLGGQEIFTDDSIVPDTSNISNNTLDWSLGSLPISMGTVLPWIYSASGAIQSFTGSDPNSYDPVTNSYGLTMGDWDDKGNLRYGSFSRDENGDLVRDDDYSNEVMYSNASGNLAVPFTEMLVGPVGEGLIPLKKLASKIPARSALGRLAIDETVGAGGEAVEEVLGNPFEEFTSYGPSGLYSSPVIDEETGEPAHDMFGHEVRRRDEPIWWRSNNALDDTTNNLNAAAGGALVDIGMQTFMPPFVKGRVLPAYPRFDETLAPRIYNAAMQDRARHLTGTDLYVSPEQIDPEDRRDLGADYASLINSKARLKNGE